MEPVNGRLRSQAEVNAAMTYALPKKPRWLILEFFSGNDVTDAMGSQVCNREKDIFEVR